MQTSGDERREIEKLYPLVIASAAKQSIYPDAEMWIASRSLSSGAHSRDLLARNDVDGPQATANP
ncbi:hypothetical protein [Bradyrhizobium valentinum]|uniref:Uncharacterized protein n=1 Tax=Bradyrhizobium valentinum TaxID=1518501 RepID=A0A0R3KGF0_9BRAD|nr:hypothetical protein [Bradyrhizobium valentinum]KRQ94697.1 hypothetical protein CP49_36325 [Bradyrhizobium valentinum]KRR08160.1 hypothetical protein CQ10_14625 [Bradyrhizobium valentinum]